MEKETYTIFKHIIGQDYTPHSAVKSIEITVDKESTIGNMMQAFRQFLLAIGYSPEGVSEYIEAE